jgi:hypothetical protein
MEPDDPRSDQQPEAPDRPNPKPYQTPRLVEWGSVEDLTQGFSGPPEDGDFTGSVT